LGLGKGSKKERGPQFAETRQWQKMRNNQIASGGDKRPQSLIYQGAGALAPAEKLSAS